MAHDEESRLDRLLSEHLAQPVEDEKAVLDGLRARLRKTPAPVVARSDKTWWLHTAAAILLIAAAAFLLWQPWTQVLRPAAEPTGKEGGGGKTPDGRSPEALELTLDGPFTDQKEIPFKQTDCPFVLPHNLEFREGEEALRLRVRFRFKGAPDFSAGVRVGVTCETGEVKNQDERVCADPRFLRRLPLWAGQKDDDLTTVAEFEWPGEKLARLARLHVVFTSVCLTKEQPLTDASWNRAIELIQQLEDEDFQRRRTATDNLVAMGEPLLSYLEMLEGALSEHPEAPRNLQIQIRTIETAISLRLIERERAKLVASLQELLTSGRSAYCAATPRLRRALRNKVSFEMVDQPLDKALESLSAMSGVAIVIDPEVLAAGPPTINLRVTDMSADLALAWTLRLADLDYAVHGNGVIVTTQNRAKLLSTEERVLSLPVEPGTSPWTEDELKRFCARFDVTNCKLAGLNSAKLVAEHAAIEDLAEGLACFGKPQPMPDAQLPDWIVTSEKSLDTKINLEGKLTVQEVLVAIREKTSTNIIVLPEVAAKQESSLQRKFIQQGKDQPAREVLKDLVGQAGLHVRLNNECIVICAEPCQLTTERVVLPLGEALKTGVSQDVLLTCLRQVLEGMPCTKEQREACDPAKNAIRGRWFLETDVWTRQRLIQVLDQTIRTRRVPPVPPLPWFAATNTDR